MANCLVVGGNGFLGSYIVDQLVTLGHNVTVFDRFTTPVARHASPDVRHVAGDFMDTEALRRALVGQTFVFHFLSTTTPASAENDPSLDARTNILQSVVLLESAVAAGVTRVYFASTGGAMYSDSSAERIDEDAVPTPVSPYAIGKLAIEGYLRYFDRKHGLESVAFRISNPYGPRQHAGKKQGVVPIFLHRIDEGLPIELIGDGSTVRDYIYAEDAARMMVGTVGGPTNHRLYNIGSGTATSLDEIVESARTITGRDVVMTRLPKPSTFIDRVVLDTSRYHEEFKGARLVSLHDGMERTWLDILGRRR